MVRLLPGIGARSAEALWTAASDALTRLGDGAPFSEVLMPLKVPAKSIKAWTQLVHTLDECAPGGKPNPPAEMLRSVIEAIYDDYAKAEFPNYDQRREDLNTLAIFARQYESAGDFLDQLALLTNLDDGK